MLVRGHVKWFDTTKGYGFVVTGDGEGDILVHGNVLRVFGFTLGRRGGGDRAASTGHRARAARRSRCSTSCRRRRPARGRRCRPTVEATGPLEPARVKWFDRVKGFGFVNIYGRTEDVFLHMETLRQYGYGEVAAATCWRCGRRRGRAGRWSTRCGAGTTSPACGKTVRTAEAARAAALALAAARRARPRRTARRECADLRDADSTLRFSVEVADTEASAVARADAPRAPAEVRGHALCLRHAAAGGVLDAQHADPARHAVLRRRPGGWRGSTRTPRRTTRRRSSGGDDVRYVLEINGGLAERSASSRGAELRHPAVDQARRPGPAASGWRRHFPLPRGPGALEHGRRGVAQPGSAAVLGTAGRWFESSRPDQRQRWRAARWAAGAHADSFRRFTNI